MDVDMAFFHEMIGCVAELPILTFNSRGRIVERYGVDRYSEDTFLRSESMVSLFDHVKKSRMPIILSSGMGIMWGAASELKNNRLYRVHVIGPVQAAHLTDQELWTYINGRNLPTTFRSGAFKYLRTIPDLSYGRLCECTLMLHDYVQHEKLQAFDLALQNPEEEPSPPPAPDEHDYHGDWELEQALLSVIEQGQLEYEDLYSRMIRENYGLCRITADPVLQARYNGIVFTSLCVRALISAGASADISFHEAEPWFQKIATASNMARIQSAVQEMYQAFVRSGYALKHNPDVSYQIQACCEYISAHLTEDLSVEVLADRLHYSPAYLERKFKSEMKSSISRYVTLFRLESAKNMLATTDLPIANIASLYRFCSASHFSEKFKEHTGILPSAYRKRYRQG